METRFTKKEALAYIRKMLVLCLNEERDVKLKKREAWDQLVSKMTNLNNIKPEDWLSFRKELKGSGNPVARYDELAYRASACNFIISRINQVDRAMANGNV